MKSFVEYKNVKETQFDFLTEEENLQVDELVTLIEQSAIEQGIDLKDLDEGMLGRVLGGAAGLLIGPAIGRVVARALGVEKGILYDLFNSRLVGAALGSAIVKHVGKK
jgi:hypothetical protein